MSDNFKDIKRFLIPVLRRASLRWSPRNDAYKNARVERGRYKCASCGDLFPPKEITLDHINPIIPLTGEGFTSWDSYISKLFCQSTDYQVLCKICDEQKTLIEDNLRTSARHVIKESEKELKTLKKLEEKAKKKLAKQAKEE